MTTATLRRARSADPRDALLVLLFLVWAPVVVAVFLDAIDLRPGHPLRILLLLGVPGALAVFALLKRSEVRSAPWVAGAACLIAAAVLLPPVVATQPKLALAIPAGAVAALLTQRRPGFALATVFALTGTYGSIIAFTGIPIESFADAILEGMWLGVGGRLLLGHRTIAVRLTPALLLLSGFMAATFFAALFTPSLQYALRTLELAPLYLSVVLLVAYVGLSDDAADRVVRVMVWVSLGVAAYASLRWAIGAAPQEEALQRDAAARQYNRLAITGDVKTQGSFITGNALGIWTACTVPLLVAAALTRHGTLRVVAAGALPLSAMALLASSHRAGTAAAVAGTLTVLLVHVLARGFRGPRLGVAVAAVLALFVSASVLYPAVIDNPEKRKRYENLLDPTADLAFQERLVKWRETLAALRGEPFGFGLGAGNPSVLGSRFSGIASQEIDNSYLMIAYDQGIAIALLLVVALLVLLVELLRHAVWTRGPDGSLYTMAGAGALVAIMVECMSANFIAARPILAGWMIVALGAVQLTRGAQRSASP